jgi:hypothetical protein
MVPVDVPVRNPFFPALGMVGDALGWLSPNHDGAFIYGGFHPGISLPGASQLGSAQGEAMGTINWDNQNGWSGSVIFAGSITAGEGIGPSGGVEFTWDGSSWIPSTTGIGFFGNSFVGGFQTSTTTGFYLGTPSVGVGGYDFTSPGGGGGDSGCSVVFLGCGGGSAMDDN